MTELDIIAALTQRLAKAAPNSIPFAVTRAELEAAPPVRLAWNADRDRLTIHQDKPFDPAALRWADRVRTSCSATGLYLGEFGGRHLALYVSAMDNSVNIDTVDPKPRQSPSPDLPVPTPREMEAAAAGLRRRREVSA